MRWLATVTDAHKAEWSSESGKNVNQSCQQHLQVSFSYDFPTIFTHISSFYDFTLCLMWMLPSGTSSLGFCLDNKRWLNALLGRLLRVDLITWVEKCPSVRPSVRPQNVSSISMKFGLYVEVDKWCMTVCSRPYDPIQGQSHEPLKVGNSVIFEGYILPHL